MFKSCNELHLTRADLFFIFLTLAIAPFSRNVLQARSKIKRFLDSHPDGQEFILIARSRAEEQVS